MKTVIIIGGGFSGLSVACYLAKAGYKVTLIDKNSTLGGRCRQITEKGFTFDIGPTWYWMPDVFNRFFKEICGKKAADLYDLEYLEPAYRVFFHDNQIDIPADYQQLRQLFEENEKGASHQLDLFMDNSKKKYDVAMGNYLYNSNQSITDLISLESFLGIFKLDIFKSHAGLIRKFFKNKMLIKLMDWPVLFLGGAPNKIAALYSLLVYSAIKFGTHYPKGGMYQIVLAAEKIAKEMGVTVLTNVEISHVGVYENEVVHVEDTKGRQYRADHYVGSCDYHYIESLLPDCKRLYSEHYWNTRVLSPSACLIFLGVNKKIDNLLHHNLFFQEDFDTHIDLIYDKPGYPDKPLFYVCCPSKTDRTVVPYDYCENLYILIPLAPGLEDTTEHREKLFEFVMCALEKRTNTSFSDHIVLKKYFSINNFQETYNAFKGNAYGLSNILSQTSFFKPSQISLLDNFYYAGQLTNPGPGIPPCLISGRNVAKHIIQQDEGNKYYNYLYRLFVRITIYLVWIFNLFRGSV